MVYRQEQNTIFRCLFPRSGSVRGGFDISLIEAVVSQYFYAADVEELQQLLVTGRRQKWTEHDPWRIVWTDAASAPVNLPAPDVVRT